MSTGIPLENCICYSSCSQNDYILELEGSFYDYMFYDYREEPGAKESDWEGPAYWGLSILTFPSLSLPVKSEFLSCPNG